MTRNDDYLIGNWLDCFYRQNYNKFIDIDLSRQRNTSIPQQINFVGKLENDGAVMIFVAEKQQKNILNFFLNSLFQNNINNRTSQNITLIVLNDSKFVTRKWNIINDNAEANYDATNEITYTTGLKI